MIALWPVVALCALLGLLVGSFLNVLAYRLPRGESVSYPPSHCPTCDALIRHRHNVPVVGWLVLRGRCADCSSAISARYPIVEAATGVLFAALAAVFGLRAELAPALVLGGAAVTLVLIRIDRQHAPRPLVATALVAGVVLVGLLMLRTSWLVVGLGLLLAAGATVAVVHLVPATSVQTSVPRIRSTV